MGGQLIDKHYSSWMYIWTELTHNVDMKELLDKLVGIKNGTINTQSNPGSLNIPLLFSYLLTFICLDGGTIWSISFLSL